MVRLQPEHLACALVLQLTAHIKGQPKFFLLAMILLALLPWMDFPVI